MTALTGRLHRLTDRLYKIRRSSTPPVTRCELSCLGRKCPQTNKSFKWKSRLRQYNPKKPKVSVLSGINGLIHNVEVYTRKIDPCSRRPDLKPSANIVLRVLVSIPRTICHKAFLWQCVYWYRVSGGPMETGNSLCLHGARHASFRTTRFCRKRAVV